MHHPTTPTAPHGALRHPGDRPDPFDLATVVGRRQPRTAALLATPTPAVTR